MNKRQKGKEYEQLAVEALQKEGYHIETRNYRCRFGEIDVVARDQRKGRDILVFIEVKYRSSVKYGLPSEAVDSHKQHKIRQVSEYYVREKRIPATTAIRYDVISILGGQLEHIENAFGVM